MKRTIYECDLCGEQKDNPEKTDYLPVPIGDIEPPVWKDVCRNCVKAIDSARGRQQI